jgi:hypothetical protein
VAIGLKGFQTRNSGLRKTSPCYYISNNMMEGCRNG